MVKLGMNDGNAVKIRGLRALFSVLVIIPSSLLGASVEIRNIRRAFCLTMGLCERTWGLRRKVDGMLDDEVAARLLVHWRWGTE